MALSWCVIRQATRRALALTKVLHFCESSICALDDEKEDDDAEWIEFAKTMLQILESSEAGMPIYCRNWRAQKQLSWTSQNMGCHWGSGRLDSSICHTGERYDQKLLACR